MKSDEKMSNVGEEGESFLVIWDEVKNCWWYTLAVYYANDVERHTVNKI